MKPSPKQSCSGLFVGLAAVDISYAVEDIPRPNQKISVPEQLVTAGGPATNAAATFAFLGGRATLVTAVGRNLLSRIIRDDLAHHSVRLHNMAGDCDGPPPVSSIMVLRRTGERSVVSANAAVFSPIKKAFDPKWLAGVSILEVDGQYMPLCIAAAKAASERNIPVVLDSGSWKPGMARLLRFVDTAICSGDFRPPGCRSEDEAFEYLVSHKMKRVAITGANVPFATTTMALQARSGFPAHSGVRSIPSGQATSLTAPTAITPLKAKAFVTLCRPPRESQHFPAVTVEPASG
jgi:sugar/nucleoside kinase (ribokinase family)